MNSVLDRVAQEMDLGIFAGSWLFSPRHSATKLPPFIYSPHNFGLTEGDTGWTMRYIDSALEASSPGTQSGDGLTGTPWSPARLKNYLETTSNALRTLVQLGNHVCLEVRNANNVKYRAQISPAWNPGAQVWLKLRTRAGDPYFTLTALDKVIGASLVNTYNSAKHYAINVPNLSETNVAGKGEQPNLQKSRHGVFVNGIYVKQERDSDTAATNLATLRAMASTKTGWFVHMGDGTAEVRTYNGSTWAQYTPFIGGTGAYDRPTATSTGWRLAPNHNTAVDANAWVTDNLIEYQARQYVFGAPSTGYSSMPKRFLFERLHFEGGANEAQGSSVNVSDECELINCEFSRATWGALRIGAPGGDANVSRPNFPDVETNTNGPAYVFHVRVKGCYFHHCGVQSFTIARAAFVTVEDSLIQFVGIRWNDYNWEGTIKVNQAIKVSIRNCVSRFNTQGFWWDYKLLECDIENSYSYCNLGNGIQFEHNAAKNPLRIKNFVAFYNGFGRDEGHIGGGILAYIATVRTSGLVFLDQNRANVLLSCDVNRSTSDDNNIANVQTTGHSAMNSQITGVMSVADATGYGRGPSTPGVNATMNGRLIKITEEHGLYNAVNGDRWDDGDIDTLRMLAYNLYGEGASQNYWNRIGSETSLSGWISKLNSRGTATWPETSSVAISRTHAFWDSMRRRLGLPTGNRDTTHDMYLSHPHYAHNIPVA